jgi:hypothetical protein
MFLDPRKKIRINKQLLQKKTPKIKNNESIPIQSVHIVGGQFLHEVI